MFVIQNVVRGKDNKDNRTKVVRENRSMKMLIKKMPFRTRVFGTKAS